MEKSEKKSRDMNFELLRIVSMILIVSSHYVLHGGILDKLEPFSFNYIFIDFIRAAARISVNLYILITGYYMIKSKIKIKKLFNTWITIVFYSITMLAVSAIIAGKIPEIKKIIQALMPISSGIYWFATAYIALYIVTPFINKLLNKLTKKQYFILIAILFVFLVINKTIFNGNGYIDNRNGESFIWFVYLYMVAGYIRLHYNRKTNKKLCILISLITPFIIVTIRVLSMKYLKVSMDRFLDFSNILNFISTICLFLYFREIKMKNTSVNKIIGKISPLMFGIYLIHDNMYIKPYIWRKGLGVYSYATSDNLVIHFILSVILVFCVCAIIEYIRIKIFDLLKHTKISQKTDEKLDSLNEKFWIIMEE